MKKQILSNLIAAIILVSQLFAMTVFGQTSVSEDKTSVETVKTASQNKVFSKYIQNLTQFAFEGKIGFTTGLEAETARLEETLAASKRKGVIIFDRYQSRKNLIISNLALRSAAADAPQICKTN